MRLVFYNAIVVLAACVLACAAFGKEITGKVTRVSDGDTVWVSDSLGRHKVRLNRIDAPESDQPYGKESAAHGTTGTSTRRSPTPMPKSRRGRPSVASGHQATQSTRTCGASRSGSFDSW